MPKIITMGQGGCLLTDSSSLKKKLERYKNFGRNNSGNDIHNYIGFNFKITDMQAVLCNAQLKNIRLKIKKKREIFKNYYENLKSNKNIKFFKFYNSETPWFIDIYVNNREKLIKHLKSKNIITRNK